jgi:hypothetical protein
LPDGKPNLTAPAPRSADGKLLNGVEGRVAGEEGYGRVQSPAGKKHQRETGPGLLIVDANGAFFVELAVEAMEAQQALNQVISSKTS